MVKILRALQNARFVILLLLEVMLKKEVFVTALGNIRVLNVDQCQCKSKLQNFNSASQLRWTSYYVRTWKI